jgi:hypothetical protein
MWSSGCVCELGDYVVVTVVDDAGPREIARHERGTRARRR